MGTHTQTDQMIEYVYIHVPFCLKKCSYCSFFSVEFSKEDSNKFVDFLIIEINLFKQKYTIKPKTIYFGGGSTSLLTSDQINLITSQFVISKPVEITLECNPININTQFANELIKTPINRISLGAQSFIDDELKTLGRLHNSDDVHAAFKILQEFGYKNISVDLIYSLPEQTKKEIEYSLNELIQLKPEHISTYCLSLGKDVPLYSRKTQIPSDEKIADFYYLIRNKLISTGYEHYEISNFAKKGYKSKHNSSYWNDKFYVGLGPSASGYINDIRYNNSTDLENYYEKITKNKIMDEQTKLSKSDHEKEYIFLGLRKAQGLDLAEFNGIFKTDFRQKYMKVLDKYEKLLDINEKVIKLKPEAYFISNEIFAEFM